MYLSIYIYKCIYIYIYMCIYICKLCVFVYVRMYESIYQSIYLHIYIYIRWKEKLDLVHSFVYFGSILGKECNFDNEISLRIEKSLPVLKNEFGPGMASNSKQSSWSIKHVFWHPSCMQVNRGFYISTNGRLFEVSINDACDKFFVLDGNPISQIQRY